MGQVKSMFQHSMCGPSSHDASHDSDDGEDTLTEGHCNGQYQPLHNHVSEMEVKPILRYSDQQQLHPTSKCSAHLEQKLMPYTSGQRCQQRNNISENVVDNTKYNSGQTGYVIPAGTRNRHHNFLYRHIGRRIRSK